MADSGISCRSIRPTSQKLRKTACLRSKAADWKRDAEPAAERAMGRYTGRHRQRIQSGRQQRCQRRHPGHLEDLGVAPHGGSAAFAAAAQHLRGRWPDGPYWCTGYTWLMRLHNHGAPLWLVDVMIVHLHASLFGTVSWQQLESLREFLRQWWPVNWRLPSWMTRLLRSRPI